MELYVFVNFFRDQHQASCSSAFDNSGKLNLKDKQEQLYSKVSGENKSAGKYRIGALKIKQRKITIFKYLIINEVLYFFLIFFEICESDLEMPHKWNIP